MGTEKKQANVRVVAISVLVLMACPAWSADVGFIRVVSPVQMIQPGLALTPNGMVRNGDADSAAVCTCYCHVTDTVYNRAVYVGSATISVPPGDSMLVSFQPGWLPANDTRRYRVDMETDLAADTNRHNDTVTQDCWVFQFADTLVAPLSRSGVTIDGQINPAEWWDARRYDISNVLGLGDSSATMHGSGSACVYLKYDPAWLYLACDVPEITANDSSEIVLFGDDDNSGTWNADSSEGAYFARHRPGARPVDSVYFARILPDRSVIRRKANGSMLRTSVSAGHEQMEIRIPFGVRPCSLNVTPGNDTCGLHILVRDLATGTKPGYWPTGMSPDSDYAPPQYGRLALTSDTARHPDVGVGYIIGPKAIHDTNDVICPRAVFRNSGPVTIAFNAFFTIMDAGSEEVYFDHALLELAAGDTADFTFAEWKKPHSDDEYMTRCSTWCGGDIVSGNDLKTGTFAIRAGFSDTGWKVLDSIPLGDPKKKVKAGSCLAGVRRDDSTFVYALKGGSTGQFYEYNALMGHWREDDDMPGRVKKAACLAACSAGPASVYASPGGSTLSWWGRGPSGGWTEKASIPIGARPVRDGGSAAAVAFGDSSYVYLLKGSGTQEFYRYNTASNAWATMASAPYGLSGKTCRDGSGIAFDGMNTIYMIRGTVNEFYAYHVSANTWTTLTGLPFIGRSGKKVKVKAGTGIACCNGAVYVMKGNNSLDFWRYTTDSAPSWVQLSDVPYGNGKRVKAGGALTSTGDKVYALKGNNTHDFYSYVPPGAYGLRLTADGPENALTASPLTPRPASLTVSPNPFVSATTITYRLPRAGDMNLKLYDVAGKLVSTLVAGYHSAGTASFIVHRSSLSAGVYVLCLVTGRESRSQKLVVE